MRQLTYLLSFMILTTCGQIPTSSYFEKSKIEIETVDSISINKLDTILHDTKLLTDKRKKEFVAKWNNSKLVRPIKSMTRFFITVYFKSGTIREFRGSDQILKEGNDFGFDIGEDKYFETLWDEVKFDHIKNIQYVFQDYIKYQESTDSQDNKDLMTKSLKALSTVTKKEDLELLINVWMYYDPTDYFYITEIYRILKVSRPHSIGAVKKRIEQKKEWEAENTAPYSDLKNLLKRLQNE